MSTVAWYVRRLRAMSGPEVVHRSRSLATRAVRDAVGGVVGERTPTDRDLLVLPHRSWESLLDDFAHGRERPVLLDRATARALAAEHPAEIAELLAVADAAVDGRFTFFGHPEGRYDGPIDWSHDPVSGVTWPRRPSHRIDHRAGHGDPKWIWELNRLQHLPLLAQAWLVTDDRRYADAALDQLDAWIEANPPGVGIAWRGAFEAGIRAISVAIGVQGLADAPGMTTERYRRIVRMLAASARQCRAERSAHSSANNHLVGELAGLAVVALLLPEIADAPRWERDAVAGLAREAGRQILPDGAGAEQAVGYQVFTAELLAVVHVLLTRRGDRPPPELLAAVERGAGYLAGIVGAVGAVGTGDPEPRYGDDDEGVALRLGPAPVRTVRAHLATAAALTDEPEARAASTPDLTSGWFARRVAAASPTVPAPTRQRSFYARHGGLVVLRSPAGRATLDVGPLGYLSIAAHGHADALAVTVAHDGRELVGDPGTASYFAHPEWRTAHRGTRAHGTVAVDDRDQSEMGGAFLWTRHAVTTVDHVDPDTGVVHAHHDGYTALDAPVTHHRWLVARPDEPTVLVVDLVEGEGRHRVRLSWPLAPDLDATATDGAAAGHDVHDSTADAGSRVLQLRYAATAPWIHHGVRGDDETHLGWWSERLESRRPTWLVGALAESAPVPVAVATVIAPGPAAPTVTDLGVRLDTDRVTVRWREDGQERETVLNRSDVAADPEAVGPAGA